jgi:hypothetical protein
MEPCENKGHKKSCHGSEGSELLLNFISNDQSMEEAQDNASSPIMINPQHPVKDPGKIYYSSNFTHSHKKKA